MRRKADIRIGISGWRYKGWRGSFYPPKLPQRSELQFASRHLNSIELNGSFYSLQRPHSFASWYQETPADFIFSVKGSRYVTHMLQLLNIDKALANFFAQGVLALREKLGPVFWQFPPKLRFDEQRMDRFFALLPRTHKEAAELGRLHDQRLDGRTCLKVDEDRPMRHAVEIRNESFVCEEYIQLLRKHRIGLVVADTVEWPLLMDLTADFVYCRLHGSEQLYASGYETEAIDTWARRIRRWAAGQEVKGGVNASGTKAPSLRKRDVYVYFDNDAKVRAPFDAQTLMARLAELGSDSG